MFVAGEARWEQSIHSLHTHTHTLHTHTHTHYDLTTCSYVCGRGGQVGTEHPSGQTKTLHSTGIPSIQSSFLVFFLSSFYNQTNTRPPEKKKQKKNTRPPYWPLGQVNPFIVMVRLSIIRNVWLLVDWLRITF